MKKACGVIVLRLESFRTPCVFFSLDNNRTTDNNNNIKTVLAVMFKYASDYYNEVLKQIGIFLQFYLFS